jgi:uncharacterized DUF497 family protein
MKLTWDEPKRVANLAKHGLDFAEINFEFFLSAQIDLAKTGRLQALGRLKGRTVIVIFRRLGSEAFSIISLRPASAAERKRL